MKIDVIIATYNRAALLGRAIGSILESGAADGGDFTIIVADNNSADSTRAMVERLAEAHPGRIRYLFEPRQGKSFALNAAVADSNGGVLAFTDDDQRVDAGWLSAIRRVFDEGYDYVTGPVLGDWEAPVPEWYDDRLRGPVSLFDGGGERVRHLPGSRGHGFSGGNGAVLRSVIEAVGGFNPALGMFGETPGLCEDSELYLKLSEGGFSGLYEPRMVVFHRVPASRLTRSYFRSWYRTYGKSMALMNGLHPPPAPSMLGIPRFIVRRTLEALPRMAASMAAGDRPGAFEQELCLWFFLGYCERKMAD